MPESHSLASHITAAQRGMGHLQALSRRTRDSERAILDAAMQKRDALTATLDQLRPQVNTQPDAADRYQEATLERGRLDMVIARAQHALAGDPE